MRDRSGVIYTIRLKTSDRVCYVGQTRMKPETRWRMYLTNKTRMALFIQSYGSLDDFVFEVIEHVDGPQLNEREAYWIATLNTLHPGGMNMTSGGSGNIPSQATRDKIGAAHRGKKRRPGTGAKISAAVKEALSRPGAKDRLSAAARKKWDDPDYRARTTRALQVVMSTPEQRAASSARNKGRVHSEVSRANMAQGNRARMQRPGEKEAVAKAVTELWLDPAYRAMMTSDEVKAKRTAGLRAYYARKRAEAATCS